MRREDLAIETPCTKDWAGMKPADAKKRFCDECRMHVHDLSSMSKVDAKTLLSAERTEGLCIRYLYDQHGDVVFREAPGLVRSLVRAKRLLLGAAAIALPLSLTACMGAAQQRPVYDTRMGAAPGPPTSPSADDAGAPIATSPDGGH